MLCVSHREWRSEGQATYRCCFSIPVESILLLLGSSNKCIVHQSPVLRLQQVRCSPILTVAPSTVAPFTNLQCCTFHECCANRHCCTFCKCTVHQSPVLCLPQGLHQSPVLHLLQVLHPSLLRFYSCTVLQCCSICYLLFCAM